MQFLRKYVVIDMSGSLGKAFFNSFKDADAWANRLRKQCPHTTFRVFVEVNND